MKSTLEDDKVFSFYLSALVTAARSVTLFMQKEFAHVSGFETWYKNKQESMRSDKDNEFFIEMRNTTLKVNRIAPNKKVSINIDEHPILVSDTVNVKVRAGEVVEEEDSPQQQDPKKMPTARSLLRNMSEFFKPLNKKTVSSNDETSRSVERFFKEYPDKNLNELCEKYLQNLTKLVDECEQIFNRKNFS